MTNLLPKQQQEVIAKEYSHRRSVVAALAFTATVVISAVFLLPSFILSTFKLQEMREKAEHARSLEQAQKEKNSSAAVLELAQGKLALLKDAGSARSAFSLIDMVTSKKNANIRLEDISYIHNKEDVTGKISVAGLAKDRESLTQFLRQIESEEIFTSVDLPVSNFAKDRDIRFSMDISGSF